SADRPILLITHQLNQAQQLYDDLTEFMDSDHVHLYPVNELIASEIAIASPELKSERIEALTSWMNQKSGVLIAPVAAMKRILPPKRYWETHHFLFSVRSAIDIKKDVQSLVDMGYERVSIVNTPGEFSQRRGNIDIYPFTEDHPIRI